MIIELTLRYANASSLSLSLSFSVAAAAAELLSLFSVQTSPGACSVQWWRPALGEQNNRLQNRGRRELLPGICALQHVVGNCIQLLL